MKSCGGQRPHGCRVVGAICPHCPLVPAPLLVIAICAGSVTPEHYLRRSPVCSEPCEMRQCLASGRVARRRARGMPSVRAARPVRRGCISRCRAGIAACEPPSALTGGALTPSASLRTRHVNIDKCSRLSCQSRSCRGFAGLADCAGLFGW